MQPINTALCSFGMSGIIFHAPFIHVHPAFHLRGVWERTKELAKEKYPDVIIYRTLEALLADEAVELVVVNTPNDTHYDYVKQALLAGKHVVVEKPFTATIAEGEELIALAKQKNRLLTVFQSRRFDSDFRTVQQIVRQGVLGEIIEAEIHYDRYKAALSPKVHKETPGPSTGALYDLGSHLTDQALQLFGKPDAVFGDLRMIRPNSKVDDYFEVVLYYPNLRVKVKGSYFAREPVPSFILHGTKGSFLKSRGDVQEAALQAGKNPGEAGWGVEPDSEQGLLHTETGGRVIRERVPTLTGNYLDFYDRLSLAIRNGEPLPVNAEDALDVIHVIETAHKSSRERKVIDY